jgi:D-tyrosyl-tRNA(Tyr) deacylase
VATSFEYNLSSTVWHFSLETDKILAITNATVGENMRALLQRVSQASVSVHEQIVGQIGQGLLVFLGVGQGDSEAQVRTLVDKIVQLRIFGDAEDKMNRSLLDIHGEILVISQFTLYANMQRGRRPSFTDAAPPALAIPLYEQFKQALTSYGLTVASGVFGASMSIALRNEGPVTIWLDTEEL